MENCIFCKIIKGQIPSSKLYEDDNTIAFLDISPANEGHALILPKKHYETYLDIPDDVMQSLSKVSKRIIKAISQALGNKGYNILMNNNKIAGQIVPHAHLHIIPRFENDGIILNWMPRKYSSSGKMQEIQDNIKKFL